MPSITRRNSSVELAKIIAIFLIVISHVAQTLSLNGYDVRHTTFNAQILVISGMRYFGSIGNNIFFLCSAWFLLESRTVKLNKLLHLILDVWLVSVLICALVLVLGDRDIDRLTIFKQFFPISFSNNWYVTYYLLFYAIHPMLNNVIESLDRTSMFGVSVGVVILCVLDSLLKFVWASFLPFNYFFQWIGIYFVMACLKRHHPNLCSSTRFCRCLFLLGLLGTFGSFAILNLAGNYISFFSEKLQALNEMDNPFILMMTVGFVLSIMNFKFYSVAINYISGLSLLVYIIHENSLIRTFYRTKLLQKICDNYGSDHIVLWVILISFVIFALATISSVVYKETFYKLTNKFINWLHQLMKSVRSNSQLA